MPNDNDNLEALAYDATSRAAWRIVRDTIAAVVEQIDWHVKNECKAGDYDDADSVREALNDHVQDWIHEACDSAMTYTRDQWICAWGLRDASDDDYGMGSTTFEEHLTAKAYANLREVVCNASEIEEAIDAAVARVCPEATP